MFRNPAVVVAMIACLALPGFAHAEDHAHSEAEHVSEIGGVRIVHAWTRATQDNEALVFFEIENRSDKTVSLTGATSEAGTGVRLVGTSYQDGAAKRVDLPAVPVKPGGEMHLDPEGMALLVVGLREPLGEGDVIEIEVNLDIGHVDVDVEVEAADATAHSHAGHTH